MQGVIYFLLCIKIDYWFIPDVRYRRYFLLEYTKSECLKEIGQLGFRLTS